MGQRLTAYRGDDRGLILRFQNEDGTENLDITGYKYFFTAKHDIDETDDEAVISVTAIPGDNEDDEPVNGLVILPITNEDTQELNGSFVYDVQQRKPDGTISTLFDGVIDYIKDVTRRIS